MYMSSKVFNLQEEVKLTQGLSRKDCLLVEVDRWQEWVISWLMGHSKDFGRWPTWVPWIAQPEDASLRSQSLISGLPKSSQSRPWEDKSEGYGTRKVNSKTDYLGELTGKLLKIAWSPQDARWRWKGDSSCQLLVFPRVFDCNMRQLDCSIRIYQ